MVFGKFRAKRPILNKILNINSKSNFKERQRRPKESPALAPRRPAPYFMGMKLTDAIKKFFRRRHADETAEQQPSSTPQPLRIEGVKPAPLTPEPDDAELAAQALLESMVNEELRMKNEEFATAQEKSTKGTAQPHQPSSLSHHTSEYYRALAERIRTARTAEARLVMRLLASVEEQLSEPTALYRGQWGDTERKLYRAMDVAEREGGELHRRWQHCLANVLVRRMEEERENAERRMKNEELSESPADPNEDTTEATVRP